MNFKDNRQKGDTEMKEIIIYEANDGTRFKNKRKCETYENICTKVADIMSVMKVREGDDIAVRQDKGNVHKAFFGFMDLCGDVFPEHRDWFNQCAIGSRHISHAGRILNDLHDECPILDRTMYRFQCIDWNSGIEYPLANYSYKPEDFKGKIL